MLEQAGLTNDDIALLADIKSGDLAAAKKLLELNKMTLDDIDEVTEEYQKKFDYKEQSETEQLAEQIMADEAFSTTYKGELAKLPDDFVQNVHADATAMKHFMRHVRSGLTKELIPQATKKAAIENIPFAEAYATLGREMAKQMGNKKETPKKETKKREVDEKSRQRRSRKRSNRSDAPKDFTADDIKNMSDAEFVKHFGE